MNKLKFAFKNLYYKMGRFRKAIAPVLILLIIPLTLFVLQYTQIFKSRAASIPGSYGYSAFGENVYGTFTVATPSATLTPPITATPSSSITPTGPVITSSPTPPAATNTPVPTAPPGSTLISLNIFLHVIGNSGDNVTDNHSSSNKNPKTKARTVTVEIRNNADQIVATGGCGVTYDTASGSFKGVAAVINLPSTGEYSIRVKETTHLKKIIPGIHLLTKGQINTLPAVHLVAGDANGDNKINILDFNMLDDCFGNTANSACTTEKRQKTDFDDDGDVDVFDYNILLRELAVQSGD